MDARPYRPRGSENAPVLHQRHKSTGNLGASTQVSNVGFRGPAKRAAFGDMTNVTKHIGRDEAKAGKNYSRPQTAMAINKENTIYVSKDALSRPAQRSAGLAAQTRTALEHKAPEANKKSARQGPQEAVGHGYVKKDVAPAKVSLATTTTAAPSLQPRHYKSQPQLKPQQPTLRRTQSKQLDKIPSEPEYSEPSYTGHEASIPSAHDAPYSQAHATYLDSLYLDAQQEVQLEVLNQAVEHAEPARLPEISEEDVASISTQRNQLTTTSEPEEYWDEEEEEYDDQDQNYTTAHSFRSRDLTTGGVTTIMAPRVTARVQRELDEAQLEVEQTRTMEEVEDELWDVSMVAEYGEEIFEFLREQEIKMLPNPHYMDIQTDIQWSMRSVLMDWLVQVHARFTLLPETLFLTVNYIDRFLSTKIVSIGKLQLVGATAILVASKYEEITCPSLEEIVYMVDRGYTMDEILKAERFMLSILNFELGWPGPMSFLRRVSKADDYDLETRTLAKYFLELTIMDERFVASPPSYLAAGAHCLSRLILNKGDWTKHHVHYSGYTWSQLKSLVTMMIECCEVPHLHHAAVYEKYSDRKYREASLLVQSVLDAGFTLPHQASPVRRTSSQVDAASELQANGRLVSIEG